MTPIGLMNLQRYPPSSRPIGAVEALGNAGGFSGARLWRFLAPRGVLVLRCWPLQGPDRAHLEQVHAWLVESADLGFLAVPIATVDGATLVDDHGRLWELADWLPGSADRDRPPAREHLRAMFAGLALVHRRLAAHQSFGPSPGLTSRAEELELLTRHEFARLNAAIERKPTDPAAPLARTWLVRAVGLAPRIADATRRAALRPLPLQPCLRDARPDHFLLEGARLTGLVDFGAMGLDSVAGDLARLLAESVGADRLARSEALRAYESIRSLSVSEARSIEDFERANAVLGPARWVRWQFIEGREFDEPDAVIRGLRRGLERLDEAGL